MLKRVKYVERKVLMKINAIAIERNRNRCMEPDEIEKLPNLRFPIVMSMPHRKHSEDHEDIRIGIMLDALGTIGWLDIPTLQFASLPSLNVKVDGDVHEVLRN